jgi:hypothetical protein
MVYFQTKNSNLGTFWRVLQCKMSDVHILLAIGVFYNHLIYYMVIWYILQPFCKYCGDLVYFSPVWYIVPRKIWQPCLKALFWAETGSYTRVKNQPRSANVCRATFQKSENSLFGLQKGPKLHRDHRDVHLPTHVCTYSLMHAKYVSLFSTKARKSKSK